MFRGELRRGSRSWTLLRQHQTAEVGPADGARSGDGGEGELAAVHRHLVRAASGLEVDDRGIEHLRIKCEHVSRPSSPRYIIVIVKMISV